MKHANKGISFGNTEFYKKKKKHKIDFIEKSAWGFRWVTERIQSPI